MTYCMFGSKQNFSKQILIEHEKWFDDNFSLSLNTKGRRKAELLTLYGRLGSRGYCIKCRLKGLSKCKNAENGNK